jgi:hypothetical protein
MFVVSKNLPVASLQELIAYAKARPGELTYSSVGPGSSQHLAGVYFEQLTGTKMRHLPYRVTAQLVTDLMTGIVPLSFQNIPNVLGQVQSGDLRPARQSRPRGRSAHAARRAGRLAEAGLAGFDERRMRSPCWRPRDRPRRICGQAQRHGRVPAALGDADSAQACSADIGAGPRPQCPRDRPARLHPRPRVAKGGIIITRRRRVGRSL